MEIAVKRGLDRAGLPVIATVARLLCRELTLQNEYLRLENRILKEKVSGRLRFTDEERRSLTEAALAMGRSLMREVVSIVKPETILAWQRRLECRKRTTVRAGGADQAGHGRLGRPNPWSADWRGRTPGATSEFAESCSSWASPAPRAVSPTSSPRRCGPSVVSGRPMSCSCCTLGTRRIVLAEATFSPHDQWMGQMARNLLMACEHVGGAPRFVLHDQDKLLAWDFDTVLAAAEAKVVKTPFRAPDANAHAERWVGSVTGECLDHLILFGMSSLQRALRVYRDFFNGHRPHQGIGNRTPDRRATGEMLRDCAEAMPDEDLTVACDQFLGGLLNSYYRKAA